MILEVHKGYTALLVLHQHGTLDRTEGFEVSPQILVGVGSVKILDVKIGETVRITAGYPFLSRDERTDVAVILFSPFTMGE